MDLWDRLKGSFGAPTMIHPTFGRITFMATKGPRPSYWEAAAIFRPTGAPIQVFIDGDESGPSSSALAAWETIQDRYEWLWPSLEQILPRGYAEWIPEAGPESGRGRFTLESLSVPNEFDGPEEWDFGYGCADDEDHSFTIRMKGWVPIPEARIDG